jgi:hypothetical protein
VRGFVARRGRVSTVGFIWHLLVDAENS